MPGAAVLTLALALGLAPVGAGAATAAADSSRHGPRPFFVMLHSAAVPGLGQVENRAWIKAAAVVAGEGYLSWQAWRAWRAEMKATDRANAAPDELAFLRYSEDRDRHRNSKINYIWWGAAAHLLQMVDAYVDAHFTSFDAEFGPDDAGGAGGARVSIALRTTF